MDSIVSRQLFLFSLIFIVVAQGTEPSIICKTDGQCPVGRFCNTWNCTTVPNSHNCGTSECARPLKPGSSCFGDYWCISGNCLVDSTCAVSPRTRCKDDSTCKSDQYCNSESWCVGQLEAGERCMKKSWCTSRICLWTSQCGVRRRPCQDDVCAPALPGGCNNDAQCNEDEFCNTTTASKCTPLVLPGNRCANDSSCASKNCLTNSTCSFQYASPIPAAESRFSAGIIAAIVSGSIAFFVIIITGCCLIKNMCSSKKPDPTRVAFTLTA